MKPFRNKGWRWFSKFESILPVAGARGRNAFTATSVTAPSVEDGEIEAEEVEGGFVSVSATGSGHSDNIIETSSTVVPAGGDGDRMDVDTTVGSSSTGKRKHSDSLTENNESINATTAPLKKKISSRGASSQVTPKTSTSDHTSTKGTTKITPAIAIHNMQGSINRLTDVMEKSLTAPDTASSQRTQAIDLLQTQDDGLTLEEQSELILKFVTDPAIAGAYLSLRGNPDLRRIWLQRLLNLNQN